MSITPFLRRTVEDRETLSLRDAATLMRLILDGAASDIELAALLGALAARGETASEIAGFATAMREAATPIPLTTGEREQLTDTCGTGGDASGTFNISTAAALVAVAAGATVAKHGNRAVTSRCGSADVLEALGIPTQQSPEHAADSLRTHRFCFLLAPAHHPAMQSLLPVRRSLGVRTVLHVLGPLLNPAGARRQVLGVSSARTLGPVAEALTLLGATHAMVVHGDGGTAEGKSGPRSLDELALSGPSEIAEIHGPSLVYTRLRPEDLGLSPAPLSALTGGDAPHNAAILRSIFSGEPGPRRQIVLLNAAAVLVTAGLSPNLSHGLIRAATAIDSGAVTALLAALRP